MTLLTLASCVTAAADAEGNRKAGVAPLPAAGRSTIGTGWRAWAVAPASKSVSLDLCAAVACQHSALAGAVQL